MKLTPPTHNVFYISLVLAVLALLGVFGVVSSLGGDTGSYLAIAAYLLLAAGVYFKGF
jgi:hypothetical protein